MRLLITAAFAFIVLMAASPRVIELEKKSILNNKVDILMPKGFEIMSEEMAKLKYPGERRPTLIYTDEKGLVNVAFNHTMSKASQEQVEAYKETLVTTFKNVYPSASWKSSGVEVINGRKVAYIELVTTAIDTNIYNLIFLTDLDDRLLLCTFNCVESSQEEWETPAHQIMNSLNIK